MTKKEIKSSYIKNPKKVSFKGRNWEIPKLIPQEEVVDQNIRYIKDRAAGNIDYLIPPYKMLSKILGGGFEFNTICTISALSGGGKSTLSKRFINGIVKHLQSTGSNPICISYNFEMIAHKTIGREVANMSKKSLREIYSSDKPLDEQKISMLVNRYYDKIKSLPILYVEEPQHYDVIGLSIWEYWKDLCQKEDKPMIVEIDHAVICRGEDRDAQKDRVDKLMERLNAIKKKISNSGGRVFFIVLSQMNRDIKQTDRRMNPAMHAPMSSDLFASSSIEFFSDYIIVSHMPAKLHLTSYTEDKLPVWLGDREKEFVYWHILKNRDGPPDRVIPTLNKLEYFDFEELTEKEFHKMWDEFRKTNRCERHHEKTENDEKVNEPKNEGNNDTKGGNEQTAAITE